mgnify:FL=1
MLQKQKRIKLYGKKLITLNKAIFERDNYSCIVCGAYVSPEHKFHHEPCGKDKSDEMSGGVVLCNECHYARHNTDKLKEIKTKCEDYLRSLYG